MIEWGQRSSDRIATLDERLRDVLTEYAATAPKHLDISITCGHRPQSEQDDAVRRGMSKVKWPNSKHNSFPAKAFDFAPYPLGRDGWEDLARFARIVGFIEACAARVGVKLRVGLDWNMNGKTLDEGFRDYPHVEVVD